MDPAAATFVKTWRRCRPLLGTYVEITVESVRDEPQIMERIDFAFTEIQRIHDRLSFHARGSELSRVNANAHTEPMVVSEDFQRVCAFSLELAKISNGLFDPSIAPGLVRRGLLPDHWNGDDRTVGWKHVHVEGETVRFDCPLSLDFGGVAKGYAVDRALAVLEGEVAIVNAGGDLAMTDWEGASIEIRTSASMGSKTRTFPMLRRSLATSAGYYQQAGHSIVNPYGLLALESQESASVFADSCMVADALTKIVLLAPDPEWILRHYQAEALVIQWDGATIRY